MKLTVEEKALIKAMAHEFFDKDLGVMIEAEEARLPAMYAGLVKMVVGALLPQLIAAMDAKVDAFCAAE